MTDHLPDCYRAFSMGPCICDRLDAYGKRIRDAVASLPGVPGIMVSRKDALAAIDALKGGANAPSTDTGSAG